jgi:hypothetical protein
MLEGASAADGRMAACWRGVKIAIIGEVGGYRPTSAGMAAGPGLPAMQFQAAQIKNPAARAGFS